MAQALTELETGILELASGAFEAFCENIAGMFGVGASGQSVESVCLTSKQLSKNFKKLAAAFTVEGKGSVNGKFFILLDQEALFTLAGTFVMLPENVITKNRKTGTESDAKDIADALGEVGNLLIGAWDRYFREEMEGHEHFLQSGTFIGKPWENTEEVFGFDDQEELAVEKYKMTVEPFDPIICCAVFPKPVLDPAAAEEPAETETQDSTQTEETAPQQASTETTDTETVESPEQTEKDQTPDFEAEKAAEAKAEPAAEKETIAAESQTDEQGEQDGQTVEEPQPEIESEPIAREHSAVETAAETAQAGQKEQRPVSKVIKQMTSSPAILPGELNGDMLAVITAQNVMRTDIAWADREDTVEATLNKMQQQNIGYVFVGTAGLLEGIVSKSDIKGALSPYLQSIFSKWKRELDTATLQIKVRWIMSRPVNTVRPDTPLSAVMEMMSRHSVRSLPVADENGICGIVTAYTIFNTLTGTAADNGQSAGQNTDVPALSTSRA